MPYYIYDIQLLIFITECGAHKYSRESNEHLIRKALYIKQPWRETTLLIEREPIDFMQSGGIDGVRE